MRRERHLVAAAVVALSIVAGLALWAAVVRSTRPDASPTAVVGVAPQNVRPAPPPPPAGVQEPLSVAVPAVWAIPVDPYLLAYEAVTVRVQSAGGTLSVAEVTLLFSLAGVPVAWWSPFLVIGECESHFSPYAVGDSGSSLGLMQMWRGWFTDSEDPFDPLTNIRVAMRVRETRGRFGGFGGWSCADLHQIP